jgi:hypothetical protein
MAYNFSPKIVTDGLVLYLDTANTRSYVSGSTVWNDLSRNGYNGSLINGPTFNSGNGGSIVFDGVNNYVEFGDVLDLGTNSMTVNQWVMLNTVSTQFFLSKALANLQNYRFSTGVNFNSPTNRLVAFMQGNSGAGTDINPYGSTILSANTWFMATFVFDRLSTIKIYYNGVLETLTGNATISQWNGLNFQSINPFRVGTYTASNNTGLYFPTNGKIAITQVYHRVLTPTEILQNYNTTKTRFGL